MRALRSALAGIHSQGGPAHDVLRSRAEALLARLKGVPVAMLVADNRGRYIDANRAAADLTGYTHRELLHMSVPDLTPGGRTAAFPSLWRAFLARGRMSGRYQVRRKNGRIVVARYFALANVLPGLHVSAMVTPALARRFGPRRSSRSRGARGPAR